MLADSAEFAEVVDNRHHRHHHLAGHMGSTWFPLGHASK
jgi:hypothetical protein